MSDLPKLIYANPEIDPDQLYITRFFAPDAFLLLFDAAGFPIHFISTEAALLSASLHPFDPAHLYVSRIVG